MADLLTLFLLTVVAIGCVAFGFFCGAQLYLAVQRRDWKEAAAGAVMLVLASCTLFSVLSMSVL